MAIRKPPAKQSLDSLISKGAGVAKELVENEIQWTHVQLRIPVLLLDEIEKVLKGRYGISRNGWILEAIQDKISKKETKE